MVVCSANSSWATLLGGHWLYAVVNCILDAPDNLDNTCIGMLPLCRIPIVCERQEWTYTYIYGHIRTHTASPAMPAPKNSSTKIVHPVRDSTFAVDLRHLKCG